MLPPARPVLAAFLALIAALFPLRAETWTTISGMVYPQVTVLKVEPDAVTILYCNGGALIPLKLLPPDLQKRFHYNPYVAQAAADARAATDLKNTIALHAEMARKDQAQQAVATETKAAVAAYKAENAHRDTMPAEPAILEVNKKEDGDIFGKPK